MDSILSILLVMLLLPRFGAVGYVYVIMLAEAFNFLCSYIGMRRKIGAGLTFSMLLRPLIPVSLSYFLMSVFTFGKATDGTGLALKLILFFALSLLCFFLQHEFDKKTVGKKVQIQSVQKKEAPQPRRCGFSVDA